MTEEAVAGRSSQEALLSRPSISVAGLVGPGPPPGPCDGSCPGTKGSPRTSFGFCICAKSASSWREHGTEHFPVCSGPGAAAGQCPQPSPCRGAQLTCGLSGAVAPYSCRAERDL